MSFRNNYSATDRILHRLAFATPRLQIDFAEAEDRALRARLGADACPRAPVFITALPRAGTTLLLNLFADRAEFASHTYRDMPFVLMPAQWSKFAARFRQADTLRERAHGDGVMVAADSPEAFEEMLWKAQWPAHYRTDRIAPWRADETDPDFATFFRTHMLKIAELRRPGASATRYISKNNVNMARLAWLAAEFPDATIVVPYRDPVQHAASLLRQHLNFLEMHAADSFARDYMAGVGHFDFGANLRPIDFGGWLDATSCRDPGRLDFWLAYWIAAYGALLAGARERVVVIGYDGFCADPARQLAALAERLGVGGGAGAGATEIRTIAHRPVDLADVDPGLVTHARALFGELEMARDFG